MELFITIIFGFFYFLVISNLREQYMIRNKTKNLFKFYLKILLFAILVSLQIVIMLHIDKIK